MSNKKRRLSIFLDHFRKYNFPSPLLHCNLSFNMMGGEWVFTSGRCAFCTFRWRWRFHFFGGRNRDFLHWYSFLWCFRHLKTFHSKSLKFTGTVWHMTNQRDTRKTIENSMTFLGKQFGKTIRSHRADIHRKQT